MNEFNCDKVIPTLQQVVTILENNNIVYRFLGSIVIAGINGRLHRKLGDLDVLIDKKGKDILYNKLTKLGYTRRKGMFSFARKYMSLETLTHPELLEVGYFYDDWQPDGSFVMGGKRITVRIDGYAVSKTKYFLHDVSFIGIPQRTAATGVTTSQSNPKRKKEIELLKTKNIESLPNNYIHITICNIKADWLYHFSMILLNVIGAYRVKLGLAFDPWR